MGISSPATLLVRRRWPPVALDSGGPGLQADEETESLPVEPCERGKFYNIDAPLTRLVLRDERLRAPESPSHFDLCQPGVEPCLLQPLQEAAIFRAAGDGESGGDGSPRNSYFTIAAQSRGWGARKPLRRNSGSGVPNEIRTRVAAVKVHLGTCKNWFYWVYKCILVQKPPLTPTIRGVS